jgi:hypothetical protein
MSFFFVRIKIDNLNLFVLDRDGHLQLDVAYVFSNKKRCGVTGKLSATYNLFESCQFSWLVLTAMTQHLARLKGTISD